MNTTERQKKIFYISMLVFTLIIALIATTYAISLLMDTQEEGSTEIYTGTLTVDYENGQEFSCNLMPIYTPTSLDDQKEDTYRKEFSITNTGTLNSIIDIKLKINVNEFPDGYIRFKLYNEDKTFLQEGELNGTNTISLFENLLLEPNKKVDYIIQIWFNESNEDQTEYMKKLLTGTIIVDGRQEEDTKDFVFNQKREKTSTTTTTTIVETTTTTTSLADEKE